MSLPRTPVQYDEQSDNDSPYYGMTQRVSITPTFLRTPRQDDSSSDENNNNNTPKFHLFTQIQSPDCQQMTQLQSSPENDVLFTQIQSSPESSPFHPNNISPPMSQLPSTPIQDQEEEDVDVDVEEQEAETEAIEADDEQDLDTSVVFSNATEAMEDAETNYSHDLTCDDFGNDCTIWNNEQNKDDLQDNQEDQEDQDEDSDASTVIGQVQDETSFVYPLDDVECEDFGNDIDTFSDSDTIQPSTTKSCNPDINTFSDTDTCTSPSPSSFTDKDTIQVSTTPPPPPPSSIDNNMQQWIQSIHINKKKQDTKSKQHKQNTSTTPNNNSNDDADSILNFSPTPERLRQRRRRRRTPITPLTVNKNNETDTIDSFDTDDEQPTTTTKPSFDTDDEQPTTTTKPNRPRQRQRHQSTSLQLSSSSSTNTSLERHQRSAVNWMLSREGRIQNQTSSPLSGGILADEEGLGQMLTTLTLISRTKRDTDVNCGGTLIVCPKSKIEQWFKEIRRKTNLIPLIYHGKRRKFKISDNAWNLTKFDVVITSFRTVCTKEIKNNSISIQKIRNNMKENGRKKSNRVAEWISRKKKSTTTTTTTTTKNNTAENGSSHLHCIEWLRVVIDEAHDITNKRTKRHKCINSLVSIHRWCLTSQCMKPKELKCLLMFVSNALQSSIDTVEKEAEIEQCMVSGASSTASHDVVMLQRSKQVEEKNNQPDELEEQEGKRISLPKKSNNLIRCRIRSGDLQDIMYKRILHQISVIRNKNRKDSIKQQKDQLQIDILLKQGLHNILMHPKLVAIIVNNSTETKEQKKVRKLIRRSLLKPRTSDEDSGDDDDDDYETEEDILSINGKRMEIPQAREGTKIRSLLKLVKNLKIQNKQFIICSSNDLMLNVCYHALDERGYVTEKITDEMNDEEKENCLMKCSLKRGTPVDGLFISIENSVDLNLTLFSDLIVMNSVSTNEHLIINRIRRVGNSNTKIVIHTLMVENTIEEDIYKLVEKKKKDRDLGDKTSLCVSKQELMVLLDSASYKE